MDRWGHRLGEAGCPQHVLAAAPLVAAAGVVAVDPQGSFAAAAAGAFNDTSVQVIGGGGGEGEGEGGYLR